MKASGWARTARSPTPTARNDVVAALKQLNNLTSDTILVGQTLRVPAANGASASAYIVQPGDTLYAIAIRNGTTPRALAELNGITNANLLAVGQPLAIPASATMVKPGLVLDPQTARQGGTLLVQLARADLNSASLAFNNQTMPMTRAAGYFYALVGISRCAKTGAASFSLTTMDA